MKKQPSRGVLRKRRSEKFFWSVMVCLTDHITSIFLKQLHWNHASVRAFTCKFESYFQNTFSFEPLMDLKPFWKLEISQKGIWNFRVKTRVEEPSYGLWRHKIELSQIVTSKLIFRNSETLEGKNENNKTKLRNSEILSNISFPVT